VIPQTDLASVGAGAQPAEDDGLGPGHGACVVSPHSLHTPTPGRGHGGAGSAVPLPSLPRAGGGPPGNAETEVLPHLCSGGGPRGHPVRTRAHAVLPWARNGTVRPPHLASPPHGGIRGGCYYDPAGHVGRGGGHAHVRCGVVQTTLPMSEGGCAVASAANVSPVARLAGVMPVRRVCPCGGTDLVPAPRWRRWAFLLGSRPPNCRAPRRP